MSARPDARFWPERMAALASLARADAIGLVFDLPGAGYATYVSHNLPADTRWGEGVAAAVVGQGLGLRTPNSASDAMVRLLDGRTARSVAAAPVLWKDQLIGAIVALAAERAFTPDDVGALVHVAALVAVEMAELRLAEEDRRQALALYELSRFATLASDPTTDLDSVTRMLADNLRHDVVGVWVANDDILHLAASAGYGTALPADFSALADTAFGRVLRERTTVSVTFGPADRRPDWAPPSAISFVVAPIGRSRAGVVAGALVLGRARASYARGDDDFAAMLGEYLAGMLQKSSDTSRQTATSERRRIAQELHDGIAQELTGVVLALEGCQRAVDVDPTSLRAQLAKASRDARATLSDVRQYMSVLRQAGDSGALDLRVVLSRLVDELRQNGVQVELAEVGGSRPLGALVERAVVRIASEALRNVAQHSGAAKAKLTLRYDDDAVVVMVEDEGKGFDATELDTAEERGHYGIVGIRERAEGVGGELLVRSERGKGTVVRASLPYRVEGAAPVELVVEPAAEAGTDEREKSNLFVRLLGR